MKIARKLTASLLCASMVLPMVSCGVKYEAVGLGKFEDALEFIGLEYVVYEGEMPTEGFYSFLEDEERGADVSYGVGYMGNQYAYMEFYDEATGDEWFNKVFEKFEDDLKEKRFEGTCEFSNENGSGYILYDGENDGIYTYGAMYYVDGVYVGAYTNTDKHKAVDEVKRFLDYLGFTKPD